MPGAAIGWLVVTATREAWKLARARAIPAGAMIGEPDDGGELAEPADTIHADPRSTTSTIARDGSCCSR